MEYVCLNNCEYDGEKFTKGQIYRVNAGMFGGTLHYNVNRKEVSQDFFKKNFNRVVKSRTTARGGDTYGPRTSANKPVSPF